MSDVEKDATLAETQADSSQMQDEPAKIEDAPTFEKLGVCPELLLATHEVGWSAPTPIQCATIPPGLQGKDLIALAETGSGKTGAFALPIIQSMLELHGSGKPIPKPYAVVLAPTRELCVQIGEQFEALGARISLKTAVVVGGLDMTQQSLALSRNPHVIVASPGRLVDHLENTKGFSIGKLKFLVLDEADRLLSMDFEEALDKILLVAGKQRQTFLFSATMTDKVSKLQRASLRKGEATVMCKVSSKNVAAKNLVQNYMLIPYKYKHTYLAGLLAQYQDKTAIVFIETCLNGQRVTNILRALGFAAVCLHGKMTQTERLGALNKFKSGRCKVLLATDVASRGLDIEAVNLVVNFDIPKNSKDYIHRVGRTARAGRSGRAVTFVTQYDIDAFKRIEAFLGRQLDNYTELRESDVMPLHDKVLEAVRQTQLDQKEKEHELKDALKKAGNRKKIKKLSAALDRKGHGGSNAKKTRR